MSALRMLAWGVVDRDDCTPEEWVRLKREARRELDGYGLWITGVPDKQRKPYARHALTNARRSRKRRYYFCGTFAQCCRCAVQRIDGVTFGGNNEAKRDRF